MTSRERGKKEVMRTYLSWVHTVGASFSSPGELCKAVELSWGSVAGIKPSGLGSVLCLRVSGVSSSAPPVLPLALR